MSEIKNEILKKLKKIEAAPFLFVGSGLSKRYLNLENWSELLRNFSERATGNPFQYELYQNEITEEKEYGKLPQIAKLLEKDFIKRFLTEDLFKDEREKNIEFIKNGVSPFKISLGEHFKNTKFDETQKEIKILKKIAQRNVAGIITTNYDQFIEKIFKGYTTYIGQEELIFSTIYETGEIYKIHGCCSKPESIVITEKDYEEFIRKSDYLTAKLLTIFLEHPIIFMGYSISDKNIRNILKSISNCLSQEKLNILKERFIFIEWCASGKEELSTHAIDFENGNRIEMVKISLNDFVVLYEGLLENKIKYNPKVLRNLKKDIYDLVKTENTVEKIKVVGLEKIDKYENLDIVLGVGISKEYGKKGYSAIKAVDLYKDLILDNKDYNSDAIVEETLPELLKGNSSGLPIFKYLKNYSKKLSDKLKVEKNRNFDGFFNRSLKESRNNKRSQLEKKSIAGILEKYSNEEAISWILSLEESEIHIEELHNYLEALLVKNTNILDEHKYKSDIKRIIRIYDYLKYK